MSAAAAAGAVSDPWILRYDGFDAAAEGLREALTTLGNGYFATRGALPEARADEVSYPGTYVAGCFNRLTTEIAGRDVVNEDMVNAPNWLCLKVRPVGGDWIDLNSAEVLEHCLELDLRRGVLTRRSRVRDAEGRTTTIRQRRFVHYREQHLAGLATEVTAEDWTGRLEVQAAIDGTVENSGVPRYRELAHKHLTPIASELRDQSTLLVVVATNQSQIRLAEAARLTINRHRVSACDDGDMGRNSVAADAGGHTGVADLRPGYACLAAAVDIDAGQTITIEKVVALHTSRDAAASAPEAAAVASVAAAPSFSELLASHELAWEALWRRTAVAVPGDAETTRNLRLHAFHTFTVASPLAAGLDVGVPARGLHGEAYRGHIFWDELYILPFVTRALPAVARSLLMYRYRRLPAARAAARAAGLPGALFPWQSGSDGREETQTMHLNPNSGRWLEDNSHLQRHVAIAIAYNVYKYIEWTADGEFADAFGTELFVELLRFLAALASENADTGRFDIRGVMGPDEYHDGYPEVEKPGIDNNVYTNVMVAWMLPYFSR